MRFAFGTIVCLSLLILVACTSGGGSSPTPATPEGAVQSAVSSLSKNDISALVSSSLPPEAYAEMEAEWDSSRNDPDSPQFAEMDQSIQMLTADGAEDQIFMMMQPQLEQAQQSLGMVPMFIGMGMGQLNADGEMDAEEQKKMQELMANMQSWLGTVDLTDEDKLKQAISKMCAGARATGITSAEQLRGLSLQDALGKAGPMLGATKEMLALYGFDLQAVLSSVKVGTATVSGDEATVPVSFTLFDVELDQEMKFEKQGENWYGKKPEQPAGPATP